MAKPRSKTTQETALLKDIVCVLFSEIGKAKQPKWELERYKSWSIDLPAEWLIMASAHRPISAIIDL